jgi:hypothetical protein
MSASPLARSTAEQLAASARRLESLAQEIERARQQETKPKHLFVHARRAAVQAAKILLDAVDAGADLLGPLRPGPRIKLDRSNDQQLLSYWQLLAMPWLRSKCPSEFAADAGAFDFPNVKTDAKGQVLGKDGRPLCVLSDRTNRPLSAADRKEIRRALQPDVETKEMVRILARIGPLRLSEAALVTDDYDDADALSHRRAQAKDWADSCRAAAGLILEQCAAEQGGAGQAEGDSESAEGSLKPSREKAYRLFQWAMEQNPDLKTDREVYDWLQDRPDFPKEFEELPSFQSWAKYLRDARAHYGDHKHTPRRNKAISGKSVVHRDQI